MDLLSAELIITFSIYSFFVFYLQKWSSIFKGASILFETFLNFFMGFATIYGLFFLIFFGYKVSWTSALVLFGISFFIKGPMIMAEAILFSKMSFPVQFICTLGFITIPILGYRLLVVSGMI